MENYHQQEQYKLAKKEVKKIKSFYIHFAVYFVINVYMAIHSFIFDGLEGITNSLLGFGLFWGIGLFFHWYGVFGKNLLFSKKWEERKIKNILDNES